MCVLRVWVWGGGLGGARERLGACREEEEKEEEEGFGVCVGMCMRTNECERVRA